MSCLNRANVARVTVHSLQLLVHPKSCLRALAVKLLSSQLAHLLPEELKGVANVLHVPRARSIHVLATNPARIREK